QFVERGAFVIPVLLPGAPAKPELPLFLQAFTWVDLRGGLTREGIDRLVWGITGTKPKKRRATRPEPCRDSSCVGTRPQGVPATLNSQNSGPKGRTISAQGNALGCRAPDRTAA